MALVDWPIIRLVYDLSYLLDFIANRMGLLRETVAHLVTMCFVRFVVILSSKCGFTWWKEDRVAAAPEELTRSDVTTAPTTRWESNRDIHKHPTRLVLRVNLSTSQSRLVETSAC